MSAEKKIVIYGASGYTGKIIAQSLTERGYGYIMAGRNEEKLIKAKTIVEERVGKAVDADIVAVNNTVEDLIPLFQQVDVVINVVGPFMQLGWPVVEACLETNSHYLDTTGEQDWSRAIGEKYGQAFADKGLLLNPACSYMWSAGALAAEVVLAEEGVDMLDITYQIDNGLPSEASTKSFLRMVCNDQLYLEQFEYKAWPWDTLVEVSVPYRGVKYRAFPWGGACEPIWFKDDPRVRDCRVLTAFGEHLIDGVKVAIDKFREEAAHLPQAEKEAWTNTVGDTMHVGEPDVDHPDVQRSVIVVHGQSRTRTVHYEFSVAAPYTWTGEICAEAALRLLDGKLLKPGFQSVGKAFDYRDLITTFNTLGQTSALPEGGL